MDDDLFMSNPAGKAPHIAIGGAQGDFNRKSDAKRYMHSIPEEAEEHDNTKAKQTDSMIKPSPPVPHVIKAPFQQPYPSYGTVLHQQSPLTTSNFVPEKGAPIKPTQMTGTAQYPHTNQPVSNPFTTTPTGSQFQGQGTLPKRTISDTSLLNTSLNGSVRIQKSLLKKMDQSIADGKHLDDDESVIELNIDDNGFLIDAQGFPILNDKGEPMKLTDDNIDFLKENGLYEEASIEGGGN